MVNFLTKFTTNSLLRTPVSQAPSNYLLTSINEGIIKFDLPTLISSPADDLTSRNYIHYQYGMSSSRH